MLSFLPISWSSFDWPARARIAAAACVLALAVTTFAVGSIARATPTEDDEVTASEPLADWTEVGAWEGATAPDAIAASALARIHGEAVEDLSQRTESSQTFALPDGQWRIDMSTGPEWVATGEDPTTEDGWAPLDTTLVRYSDHTYRTAAHPGGLIFSGAAEGRVLVASGSNADGHPFELWWTGQIPEPIVDGDAIRYVDVEPGIDLVFFVTATGYEQFLVAKTRDSLDGAGTLTLEYKSPENPIEEQGDGFVVLGDDGSTVAHTGAVQVWDAVEDQARLYPVAEMAVADSQPADVPVDPDRHESAPPESTVLDAETAVEGSTGTVRIDTDDVVIDEATVFPVVIDPSVNLTMTFDTYVSTSWNVDRSTETELLIGTHNSGTGKFRAFFNVNVSPIIGKKVSKATLSLYNHHSWSCTAKSWEVWSTATTSTSTRWTNMPALATKIATSTATKGYSSSCAGAYVSADVTTLASTWAGQSTTSRGMAVKATSETDNFSWKRFYSGNNASNKPKLSVTFNSYPNTPASVKVNGTTPAAGSVLYTNSTRPSFSAVVKDPDSGSQVRGRFTVTTGSTTVVSKASGTSGASGVTSTYSPPALAQGKAYAVEVWGYDGALDSKSSVKPSWTVYVDTVAPGATTVTSPQFAHGEWKDVAPSSISTKFTATDAVKFEYRIDGAAAKTVTATSGSATVSGLPRTKGGHKVQARAVDRAGNTSAWKLFEYGVGSVGIASPASGYKTIDKVPVTASAPPAALGNVNRVLQWRPSGTTTWQTTGSLDPVGPGVSPEVDLQWSAAEIARDADKERVPFAIDVQVCFTYTYTNDTLCTWGADEDSHRSIIRVPHAFGDNFPVASAGPGQVALWTGEFNTSVTDVELPGYTGTLSLSRSYSTFAGGTEGSPFGPGWSPSFDGSDVGVAGLAVLDSTNEDAMIAFEDVDGSYLLYGHANATVGNQPVGEYLPLDDDTAALGYAVAVSTEGSKKFLTLVDDEGVTTRWEHVGGGAWVQSAVIEPGGAGATTFTRDSLNRVSRILAPVPHGLDPSVCAGVSFVAGCRALYIDYHTTTGVDGSYAGRVSAVRYRAWDPLADAVAYQDVAAYRYAANGRLASVRDERSGVTMTYGYATSTAAPVPLLTSITPGGLAAWNMEYDSSAELVRVTRDAPVLGGAVVPMSRFVYRIDTTSPPSGTPNIQELVQAWGQSRVPSVGFAVFGPDEDPGDVPVEDIESDQWKNAQLSYTDDLGYTLNSAEFGAGRWLLTADEFDEQGNIVRSLDAAATAHLMDLSADNDGEPVAESEVNAVASITRYNDAIVAESAIIAGDVTIAAGTELVPAGTLVTDTWGPSSDDGPDGRSRIHTRYTYDEGAPNSGINPLTQRPFSLVTSTVETSASHDTGTWDREVSVASGEPVLSESRSGYDPIDGADVLGPTSGWILGAETVSTLDMGADADIVSKVRYDDLGRTIESRGPGSSGTDAGTQLAYFYTVAENPAATQCGGVAYAKWAGLPCLTRTAEATPTIPSVQSSGFSMLLAPATIVEALGAVTRTTTTEYLPDGRTHATRVETAGLVDSVPLDRAVIEYDNATGLPIATVSYDGATETGRVSTTSDLWGRNITYTDADGQISTNTYDSKGRLASVVDPHGTVTYGYDGVDAAGNGERRSLGTSMTIAGVGTFTAAYDASGNVTVQTMPGGITQNLTYTLTGEPVSLAYTAVDSHDETISILGWEQESDLYGRVIAENTPTSGQAPGSVAEFSRTYEYDLAGRLVTVHDRSAGIGENVELPGSENDVTPCVTRTYDFDVRGNRLARHTAVSGLYGVCTSSGGFSEVWNYDGADRVQSGANGVGSYQYDALGRQLVVPAIDSPMGAAAGNLQIGYYANDLVFSLTQDGTTSTFELDPLLRRTKSTAVTGATTASVTRHYADASDAPAWVVAKDGNGVESTTWYGSSLGGDLGVTVTDGVAQVQLADLHGDIAIPVKLGVDAVEGMGGFSDFDEYGRPLAGTAAPDTGGVSYGWLGGKERATDEATGLMLMGVRLYNPNTGLFTSVDPEPGGNTTAYTYPQDPINKFDLDGRAWGWLKKVTKVAKAVAKVAEVVSFIPGPIGMVAAGVATAGYLASGDYKAAGRAAVGLVPGGKALATVVKVGGKLAKAGKVGKSVKAGKKATARRCNSFEAGTEVVLADGSSVMIEDVVIGDLVLSSDGTVQSAQPVVALIRSVSEKVWVELKITTSAGVSELVATDEHPFWVIDAPDVSDHGITVAGDEGRWVNAINLRAGDVLLTATGQSALVSDTTIRTEVGWAYNFTVANTHTYYAGDEPVLTHNKNVDACGLPPLVEGRLSGTLPKKIRGDLTVAQLKAARAKLKASIAERKSPKGHYSNLNPGHQQRLAAERRLLAEVERRLSR